MKFKKFMALALATTMSMSLVACGSNSNNASEGVTSDGETTSNKATPVNDTLVIGNDEMNGVFNPFFYSSGFDSYAFEPVFDSICTLNDDNELVPLAGNITYEEFTGEDGKDYVEYTVTLQPGIKFHDGIEATIDDVIFSYYVYADPSYDGLSTFGSASIVGLEEYRTGGAEVESISGIQKIDDYTCTVLFDEVSIISDRFLNAAIMPSHYYGIADDGTVFTKGDMSVPKSRNDAPMGTGAYVFKSYENNIISYEANQDYFLGAPATPYLKLQVVSTENKLDVVRNGEMDITDPTAEKETMQILEEEGIEYNLTNNNGYGYIGINAERVSDINVRKALMHLMNRAPSIESYYGDLAEVIERPMTSILGEYPEDAEEYYGYDKEKAMEYLTLAGYTNDSSGKLVDRNGNQLVLEVGVGSLSSHPSAGILSQLKSDLDSLGAELIISDLQSSVLFDRMSTGDLDLFVAAWGSSTHADLTQIFHSSSVDGAGSNHFNLQDPAVDALIEEARTTLDLTKRKEVIAQLLDQIMENAVIMPVYQRKNLNVFNGETLNIDTVYRTNSPFHTFRDELYVIEMQ